MSALIAHERSTIAMSGTDAPEFFVSGLARAESMGANVRFVCFGDYLFERRVNPSVIVPKDAVGPAIELPSITLGAGLITSVTRGLGHKPTN
jgi:hypothetical protein